MKLRIAKKVYANVDEWGNTRNRDDQLARATRRINKLQSTKDANANWRCLMALVRKAKGMDR